LNLLKLSSIFDSLILRSPFPRTRAALCLLYIDKNKKSIGYSVGYSGIARAYIGPFGAGPGPGPIAAPFGRGVYFSY
jgi:hypothetical protein